MKAAGKGRPPTSRRAGMGALGLLVIAIAWLAYARGFSGPFVLDDELSVTENYSIRRLTDWRGVFSPPGHSTVGGRPVANFTFALNYAAGGLSPAGYRVTNLLIHFAAALLLFGLARRTLARRRADAVWLAGAVAAIWLLHPVQSATVAYISQRTEELMGLFYLLTLYAFIRGVQERARGWLAISVAACALGMGSKEVMVTAPVVVFLYDRAWVGPSCAEIWRARWRYYLGLAATWLLLAGFMSGGLSQRAVGFGLGITPASYALTETEALTTYLRLAPWPHPLVFDYGPTFLPGIGAALPFGCVVLAAGLATLALLRKSLQAGFLAATFFILLAPTSSFVPVAAQPIAESRMYLPLACAVGLGVAGLFTLLPGHARWLAPAVALACGLQTSGRVAVLRDPLALWGDTLAKRPENARVRSNWGAALFALGRTDEAMAHEKRALELDPTLARAQVNYAAALLAKGRLEEALEHGLAAVRLAPRMTDAHYQVGNALARLGRPGEAVEHYRAELQLRPDYADAYSNLGGVLYMLGRPAEAIPQFETALRLKPDSVDARNNLAGALSQTGRPAEAVQLYRASLAAHPADFATRGNLALVLAQMGRLDEAEAEFRAVLQLRPDFAPAREGLAGVLQARAQKAPGR